MDDIGIIMDFYELVEEVKKTEKNAGKKEPYDGTVELPKTIDFSPEEFVDKTYQDILNDYERIVKIAKVLGIPFAHIETPVVREKPKQKVSSLPKVASAIKIQRVVKHVLSVAKASQKADAAKKTEEEEPTEPKVVEEISSVSEHVKTKPISPFEFEKDVEKERARPKISKELEEPDKKQIDLEEEEPTEPKVVEEISSVSEHVKTKPISPFEFEKDVEKERARPKISKELEEPDKKQIDLEEEEPTEPKVVEEIETVKEIFPSHKMHDENKNVQKEMVIPINKDIFSQGTKEIIGEVSEIPYIENHENISLLVPSLLSIPLEQSAEHEYAKIEGTVPRKLEIGNVIEIKKRMLELTKQLFKEESLHVRQEITNKIAELRDVFSRIQKTPGITVSYSMNFFNSTEIDQKMEFSIAKENLIKQYREQLSKTLDGFSFSLRIAMNDKEKKKAIYDMLVLDLENLLTQFEIVSGKCESFFIRKHEIVLEKLRNMASLKNDKYVVEKTNARIQEIKFSYSAEFLSLKNTIRKEIFSVIQSKKHEALESFITEEIEKILSIVNMKEEELLKYMHAHHEEKYKEFENGKTTKLELLTNARECIAIESGLKKETIDKYFG